jgi:hypothetical protein
MTPHHLGLGRSCTKFERLLRMGSSRCKGEGLVAGFEVDSSNNAMPLVPARPVLQSYVPAFVQWKAGVEPGLAPKEVQESLHSAPSPHIDKNLLARSSTRREQLVSSVLDQQWASPSVRSWTPRTPAPRLGAHLGWFSGETKDLQDAWTERGGEHSSN